MQYFIQNFTPILQVEERLAREEHLIWLLSAITAYIYCVAPDFSDDRSEKVRLLVVVYH